jgi:low temperature requirement protein LtrA
MNQAPVQPEGASRPTRINLLREIGPEGHARVGFIELFFDLIFVFAITQLSHHLVEHFTPLGAFQTLLLFMAVWWAWIDTAWVTNWLDPQKWPVRVMLLVLMFAGLILSTSIREAFGERGLYFAVAYAVIQVGRAAFTLWALRRHSPANFRNFQRITIWFSVFSALWIAGGLADGELRLALWTLAVIIETAAPSHGFYVPGLSRSTVADWDVDGGHMAERCGLFIIIALGESILVTGGTFAALTWDETGMAAFAIAFLGSVAMWWIYFDTGQERGLTRIAHSDEPGRIARLAYTYLHLPIVAGIIVAAVGDELLLAHPEGHTDWKTIAAIAGGPALYLVGTALFKRSVTGHWPWTHLGGLAALVLVSLHAQDLTPLAFATRVAMVLVVVGALETVILRIFRRDVLP